MRKKERILKKHVKRSKETKEKISVKSLVEKLKELDEILPYITDPIDKTSMKYLSSLYSETIGLIKDVTVFMVHEKYCGMHKTIDDSIIKTQNLIRLLKEFESLNSSRKAIGFIDENSQKEASFLLRSLKKEMDELLKLRMHVVEENDGTTTD